jgi:VCBS repeat-containing protein
VLANDTDADGNTLSAVLVSRPTLGSLNLNADGSFVYTPDPNYNGSDSFTYKANDGSLRSPEAAVILTVDAVNDAPSFT